MVIRNFLKEFMEQLNDIKKGHIKRQIPNILTFSRALAPFIIIPTIMANKMQIAIAELTIFAITDFLDGRIARKYNLVSKFGIKLDAVCDKIFAISLVIPAIFKFNILILNLLLEFAISITNVISYSRDNISKSIIVGKIKTVFLSITLIFTYIPGIRENILFNLSMITSGLQIIALVKYIMIAEEKKKK